MTFEFYVFKNLLLCIAIEAIIAILFGIKSFKDLFKISLVNLATNPLLSVIMFFIRTSSFYSPLIYWSALVVFEIAILFIEGLIFKFLLNTKKNPIKLSAILNGLSFSYGLLITISLLPMK